MIDMRNTLTDKQKRFIDVLFEEADGDVVKAKVLAGYSKDTSTTEVIRPIKEEIIEATQMYMARNAPVAAVAIRKAITDPTALGTKEKLAGAREFLDRSGLVKTDKLEVKAAGGVMLMPPKNNVSEDD